MKFFKEGDIVLYAGDITDPIRKERALVRVEKIDSDLHPYVGVEILTNNQKMSVNGVLLRPIITTHENLESLGFVKRSNEKGIFFQLEDVLITYLSIEILPGHWYLPGFRIIPQSNFEIAIKDYLVKNDDVEIDHESFNKDFPDANNLFDLVQRLNKKGLTSKRINDFIDI